MQLISRISLSVFGGVVSMIVLFVYIKVVGWLPFARSLIAALGYAGPAVWFLFLMVVILIPFFYDRERQE